MSCLNLPIDHINSATKYPSIPTYHVLKGRGVLTEQRSHVFGEGSLLSEKVNGQNGRIIFFAKDGDYLLGSRDVVLTARGDRVPNQTLLPIVEAMQPLAESMAQRRNRLPDASIEDVVLVIWGEVYGGKQYSGDDAVSFRVFDAARFTADHMREVCSRERAKIAEWREAGNQPFRTEAELRKLAAVHGFYLTPRLSIASVPPAGIAETHAWLKSALPSGSLVNDGGTGQAEGVIVRTTDRKHIAKLRFEDYERAARVRSEKQNQGDQL